MTTTICWRRAPWTRITSSSPAPIAAIPVRAAWVVNDGYPMPPWLTNGPDSKWIAPRNAQNIGNLPGNYTYRLTFNLTGLQPNAAVINGNWAVDNSGVDILLNGVSTGQEQHERVWRLQRVYDYQWVPGRHQHARFRRQ